MKRLTVVLALLLMIGNVLCVNASDNLDEFEKTLEGTWEKTGGMSIGGIDHSFTLEQELEIPNSDIIFTEDSTGLVYITAFSVELSDIDIPTMGIVTLSSDKDTMIIKDTVGGVLIYTRK